MWRLSRLLPVPLSLGVLHHLLVHCLVSYKLLQMCSVTGIAYTFSCVFSPPLSVCIISIVDLYLLFIGSSSYDDWDYDVEYQPVQSTPESLMTATTTSFNITLTNLQPESVYQLNVIARGPGGSVPLRETLLFSTLSAGVHCTCRICCNIWKPPASW